MGNGIFVLTATPGKDAGLVAGQSKPQEPPIWLSPLFSQTRLAHSLFPSSNPLFLPSPPFPHF